jgi:hypothetical protein
VIDESGFQADSAPSGVVAVDAKPSASPAARGRDAFGDNQVHGDEDGLPVDRRGCNPDTRLEVATFMSLEMKPGAFHSRRERGIIVEQARVDREIPVDCVGSDTQIGGAGPEIDGLGSCHDHSAAMRRKRNQCVQEDVTRSDVTRVETRGLSPLHDRCRARPPGVIQAATRLRSRPSTLEQLVPRQAYAPSR